MKHTEADILIIGAGLSGLSLAHYLREHKVSTIVLEGRPRIGGRILTTYKNETPLELGATWLSLQHTELRQLLKQLNLETFEQELGKTAFFEPNASNPHQVVALPHNQEPSFRIKGGSSSLIRALQDSLDSNQIKLDHRVSKIIEEPDALRVLTRQENFKAKAVISTLPPFLFTSSIDVQPSLPQHYTDISSRTHTWMGESIKIGLSYVQPFWKEDGLSGTIFSNPGPIPEMYDHSNFENSRFALKGFLNGACFSLSKEERLEMVMNQLEKYYGSKVRAYMDYQEMAWQNEVFTYAPYKEHIFPHQNNGHEAFRQPYLTNRLFISGSETSRHFPGYMEGAVRSSLRVLHQLKTFQHI